MTTEVHTEDIHDLIIQGTKEAIDLELQRLRKKKRSKYKYAGLWALTCSVACAILSIPIAIVAGMIATQFFLQEYDLSKKFRMADGAMVYTFFAMLILGLLFLILGFIIGGKYTRRACAIDAGIVIMIICAIAAVILASQWGFFSGW